MTEMVEKSDDEPPLNAAIEDLLARCGSPEDIGQALSAWLLLGAEYMARECGRSKCMDTLHGLRAFVRDAEPGRPWPP